MKYFLILTKETFNPKNKNYDETFINRINELGTICGTGIDYENDFLHHRQSIDKKEVLIGITKCEDKIDRELIGEEISKEILDIGILGEERIESIFNGEEMEEKVVNIYNETALVEEKLELAIKDGIIKAYAHYPHLDDGKKGCAFCYIKKINLIGKQKKKYKYKEDNK